MLLPQLNIDFYFLISRRTNDGLVLPELLNVYTYGSKLDSGVRSGVYSTKLDLNISFRLPDYYFMFQEAMDGLLNGSSLAMFLTSGSLSFFP